MENIMMRYGCKGEAVKQLQQLLNITKTGIFDTETCVAVCRFQQENNIDIDGIVSGETWTKIQEHGTN